MSLSHLPDPNYPSLNDRIVVLTGASGGIGQALAKKFTANGAKLALWDSNSEALNPLQELYPSALLYAGDLTQENCVRAATEQTLQHFGRIDVLVHAVGILGPYSPVATYDTTQFQRVFDINMHSTFLCNKYVLQPMLRQKYGRIINISSIAGKEGNAEMSAYSASKAAVIGFTKSLGKEVAKDNVLVNCITPAVIASPLNDQLTPEELKLIVSKIPMGRVGQSHEVADLVLWLASENCSFSAGACFDLSGGRATY
ncbi:SDR family oxidoreductase [Paenalcaligenes hominis]|uniref:SDR family oxidoreductase n=1 Tax=Paenalcaligenes hominis TaxID=643674 RepID=UPI00352325A2